MRSRKTQLLNGLLKILLAAFIVWIAVGPSYLRATDLPLAAGSPLAGFSFDDRPLLLPVQRNFQMAMLTASSEIGRSCGKMESYGWRMSQSEQQRVNLIFNNTVDRLRALGYVVEAQAPNSLSRDVTMFTADRPDKHFIFMWSAGEIGLAMVLCESSPPLTGSMATTFRNNTPSVQTFPPARDVLQSRLDTPVQGRNAKGNTIRFSPVGDWVGDYACMQGQTGGTLHISSLKGEDFQGVFRFYPTAKNRYASRGSYTVYGQYDPDSHRVLINPGKWIQRPKNYYNTIIVGSFDPVARTFSGFFQGIMGCTSFEAKYAGIGHEEPVHKKTKKKAKSKPKTVAKPAASESSAVAPVTTTSTIPPVSDGIKLPDSSAVPPLPTPTPSPAPAAAPPPVVAPPAPAPVAPAPTAPMPTPATTTPPPPTSAVPPSSPAVTPPTLNPVPSSPKPTSSTKPESLPHPIVVAGGWITPTVPELPLAPTYNTIPSELPPAPSFNANVPVIPPVPELPLAVQAPLPNYVAPSVPEIAQAPQLPLANEIPQAPEFNPGLPQVQPASQLPPPDSYADP